MLELCQLDLKLCLLTFGMFFKDFKNDVGPIPNGNVTFPRDIIGVVAEEFTEVVDLSWFDEIVDDDHVHFVVFSSIRRFLCLSRSEIGFRRWSPSPL
ncbi:MAG: hypothetical protein U1C97_02915 [Candidatus Gracilibacteria bacterium]|nr:hypothetical protein [Candidatus Gracilibacteria bacterium]